MTRLPCEIVQRSTYEEAANRPMTMRRKSSIIAAVGAVALLAGCSLTDGDSPTDVHAADHAHSDPDTPAPSTAATPSPVPKPTVRVANGSSDTVPWQGPVKLAAAHGWVESATVHDKQGDKVQGHLVDDGREWRSKGRLFPSTTYTATVDLRGEAGSRTRTVHFTTSEPEQTLSMSALPGPGQVVGVGEPISVTFNTSVPDKAAVEKAMSVTTSGGHVKGAWHWFSDSVVHFRPKHYWPAHTTVKIEIDLDRLYAGDGVWGDRMHDWSFQTGDKNVSYVNASKHTFTFTKNGKTVGVWPTGTGQPGFDTRDGTYIVLGKSSLVQMDSCSVGISCEKGSSNYYDLPVHWATRLTTSGTFVHAAPWDSVMGSANTSHGCIHLSTAHGKRFYELAQPGDVVVLTGSPRSPNPGDAGMMDWNMSWSQWLGGSALH
ncbi:MAG: Ig-like domain-containing protein [Nocardioidaceae bacterium]